MRKVIKICFWFSVIFIWFSVSCADNSEEELYGKPDCDLTNATWTARIDALQDKNCVQCHGPQLSYNGVRHDEYVYEMIVVKDGRLRGVINHLDGYAKMPKDRGKLPSCELALLNKWLDKGAPEN